jgi:hypothetical protein
MALTPSKRYRNFTNVVMAGTTITGVRSISNNNQATVLQEAADADQGPTHTVLTFLNPAFTILTNHAMVAVAVLSGVSGVFTYTFSDSKNLSVTGGGAMIFTTNALSMIGERTIAGEYNQLGTENLSIHTSWADGVTNPVSVAAA